MKERAPRVLLADDDAVAMLVAQAALEGTGFEVVCAGDGVMAVEQFGRQRPDIVILDVVMPRMDGYEACRRIRALPAGQDVPILIMTSHDDVEAVASAYDSGATDFTSKGISNRLMVERVRFMLREHQSRRALVVSRGRLSMVQKMARIGHWEVDASGRTLHVSDFVRSVLDGEAGAAAPTHLAHLVAAIRPDTSPRVLDAFRGWQKTLASFRIEVALRNGTQLHLHGATTPGSDKAGAPTLTLAVQDISELRTAQREAHLLANFDTLTGLPNRRQFLDRLGATIGRRAADRPLWVLVFWLRGLDRVQRSLGQAAFDGALVGATRLLLETLGLHDGDAFTHLGAGEFALCRSDCASPAEAAAIAEAVGRAFAAALSGDGWTASFQVHTGIAGWPADGSSAEALLENARAIASRTTAGAESGYEFFRADTQQRARRRMDLESALHGALERGELELAFQPRVTLADGVIRGSEALMRWTHPQFGGVSPGEFIPIAEDTGLIATFGAWALREACRRTAQCRSSLGRELHVSVNVSAQQLRHPHGLVADVLAALESSGLPAGALELELTESAFIDADEDSLAALRALRERGISLALDDFGTGYSSLGYLRRLPVDCLKIDRSFVADLPGDEDAGRMLEAILGIAAAMRLRTVAEGVETETQLAMLRRHGCLEAQGFLISRPVPAAAFRALLEAAVPAADSARRSA
jgi:predicted signal transduction protein with EAL and GGDEF domain/DNA-binding response OmpR family regulator